MRAGQGLFAYFRSHCEIVNNYLNGQSLCVECIFNASMDYCRLERGMGGLPVCIE